MTKQTKTSVLALKERKAVEMRLAGANLTEIAEALGYSAPSSAYRAVMRAISRDSQEDIDELRRLEAARLDAATAAIWPQVLDGDLQAVRTYVRISARRARMLGLDPPQEFRGMLTLTLLEQEATRIEHELVRRGVDPRPLRALPSPPADEGASGTG
jgi:hypothetical protein